MLVERTEVTVEAARADAFNAEMASRGLPLLRTVPGALKVQGGRGVENPAMFMLLITWETMEAHAAYNKTAVCEDIRRLIGGYATAAAMEHFELD